MWDAELHRLTGTVLLAEKQAVPGGISICSYGSMRCARSADDAFAYLKATNTGRTPEDVLRVLADGMAKSGLRPDEYAVYSLLFDDGPLTATEMSDLLGMPLTTVLDYLKAMSASGHLDRMPHPSDGRAVQLRLSRAGVGAHKRAHDHWEVVRKRLEAGLPMPIDRVRLALQALDDAAVKASAPPQGRHRATSSPAPTVGLGAR